MAGGPFACLQKKSRVDGRTAIFDQGIIRAPTAVLDDLLDRSPKWRTQQPQRKGAKDRFTFRVCVRTRLVAPSTIARACISRCPTIEFLGDSHPQRRWGASLYSSSSGWRTRQDSYDSMKNHRAAATLVLGTGVTHTSRAAFVVHSTQYTTRLFRTQLIAVHFLK